MGGQIGLRNKKLCAKENKDGCKFNVSSLGKCEGKRQHTRT